MEFRKDIFLVIFSFFFVLIKQGRELSAFNVPRIVALHDAGHSNQQIHELL